MDCIFQDLLFNASVVNDAQFKLYIRLQYGVHMTHHKADTEYCKCGYNTA